MSQPIKPTTKKVAAKAPKTKPKTRNKTVRKRSHAKYGTSKLEDRFAEEFLDRLGVEYQRQFEARDIGRFYDFYLPEYNLIIEVDGDYYHSYGLEYEQMSPMQKRNRRVDEAKNTWALEHGIPIMRIWEHEINKTPKKVMAMLEEALGIAKKKKLIKENKKKRH